MWRARGPWELPRILLIGGHAAFLGEAYEAAPLRRAVRLWLPPCRSRAGSFRFARPSGLRCRALPRASDTASCPSLLETGRASLAASGHHIGALPEAAMVRLSSVAWACPLFSPDTPPSRDGSHCRRLLVRPGRRGHVRPPLFAVRRGAYSTGNPFGWRMPAVDEKG